MTTPLLVLLAACAVATVLMAFAGYDMLLPRRGDVAWKRLVWWGMWVALAVAVLVWKGAGL